MSSFQYDDCVERSEGGYTVMLYALWCQVAEKSMDFENVDWYDKQKLTKRQHSTWLLSQQKWMSSGNEDKFV